MAGGPLGLAHTRHNLEPRGVTHHVEEGVQLPPHVLAVEHVGLDVGIELVLAGKPYGFGALSPQSVSAGVAGHVVDAPYCRRLGILPPKNPLQGCVGRVSELDMQLSKAPPDLGIQLQPATAAVLFSHA